VSEDIEIQPRRKRVMVELCAGSAAVSLRWLRAKAKPPLSYQGGKRGYADAILEAMGQHPGGGEGCDVVLCEPGPWGESWDLWRTSEGRADTIARLEAWAGEDPRALWERLRRAAVPAEAGEKVATWAVLQQFGFGCKPVLIGDRWAEHGYAGDEARAVGAGLPWVIAALRALPPLDRVHVHRGPAQTLPPIPGALVYIDPPYEGTTGYGHAFPRADVLAVAEKWCQAGCVVAVSEACPLPLHGWYHHPLAKSKGFGRTWSKQQHEWLTLSVRP